MDIYQRLKRTGILPIITITDPKDAVPVARALSEGGLTSAEFTFRTDAAQAAIGAVAKQLPEMLVGAGTVLTAEQVDAAAGAGAKFIVTPGLNRDIVEYCFKKDIPVFPGVSSASDIDLAVRLGLNVVKFFPAGTTGGIANIKALAAPFTKMRFIPTGGINAKNLNDYLAFERVDACGGSWMIDQKLISDGDFDGIKKLAKQAVDTMLGFEFAHLGINDPNEQAADKTAKFFCDAFSFEYIPKQPSIFSGPAIEVMKNGGKGKNGHIGFYANNVERAIFHLEARGYSFDSSTARISDDGECTFIYFEGEYGGFAIHLLQR